MIFGAIAEGFGLLMIVPLASIAIGGDASVSRFFPWAMSWTSEQRFMAALALFIAAMGARSLLLYARDLLLGRLRAGYEADLRLRAAATLARRGWTHASRMGQAAMQSLLLTDVPRAAQGVAYLQTLAAGATMLLVQIAVAFILSPRLTLVAIGFLLLGFLVSVRLARRGAESGLAIRNAMAGSADSGFRLHAGLKAALAQGTVPAFIDEYRSTLQRTADQSTHFAGDSSSIQQSAAFAAALVAAVLLFVGVRVLDLPFPVLVASLALFARMSAPAQMLQTGAYQAAAYAPAFAAIERQIGKLGPDLPPPAATKQLQWKRLELDGVAYEHRPGLGLVNTSLQLGRGEWLGVRGVSGAGKTTLVDLVAGLLEPQRGSVEVDGRPLSGGVLDQWRAGVAYVGQEGSVFSDTVRGNLLAEGARADNVDLWQALETVGLAERVRAFPNGINEDVGDRGSQLSGGERQRLVLARALLRRPSLLILDEATAALDPEAEAELIGRLKAFQPRPAAIVVAHRDSTLNHCDSVISVQHES